MRLVSVNAGQPETIRYGEREFVTGICKRPVDRAVHVSEQGLLHDAVCDQQHHGGPDQAIYAYGAADYAWWSGELGRDIAFGTFGDNLTIDALPDDMNTGDRLLIGNVILEVTAPRIPCSTLAARMQDSGFGLRFRRAERPGYYFRVLNEGSVRVGDDVTLVENTLDGISILEQFRLSYTPNPTATELRRALDAPIAERMRVKFEARLAAITAVARGSA